MNFAVTVLTVGIAGCLLASNLQGAVIVKSEGLPATVIADATILDTGAPRQEPGDTQSVRLIDLRSGATCKLSRPDPAATAFVAIPFAQGCTLAPGLARIAVWRSTPHGNLIMADSGGGTILEFAPGKDVLYESVFPTDQFVTIVPAKG